MDNDDKLKLDLLKISIESYNKNSEWIYKALIIYLAVVGTIFGITIKSEVKSVVISLHLLIILASIIFIYFTFLIKYWVKKISNAINSFEEPLKCKLDHIYYPSEKVYLPMRIIAISILTGSTCILLLSYH